MGVDPKAKKKCEWCGRWMRPHYNPDRGRYESEHWERPADFAKRRFCSRRCQGTFFTRRVQYAHFEERNERIVRLRREHRTVKEIAAEVGVTSGVVMGVLHHRRVRLLPAADRKSPAPDARS
jgi:hypothetical protein